MRGYQRGIWLREMEAEPRLGPPAVQGSGWNPLRTIRQPRRHADCGTPGRHVMGDHRSRPDLGEVTDAEVPENGRPGAEQDATANPGGAAGIGFLSSDGDVLIDRHLIA